MERVRVGEVVRLERRAVLIDPDAEYRLIGVYSFGKGIFHREPKLGVDLGDYRFFRIQPGDLVLSNIQAWEGAIGLAGAQDRGMIGTHRFLSYVPVTDRIDTNWARWFFLSERGMHLIRRAAPGTAVRNRTLAVKRFEDLVIPLPPAAEQRRVAAKLGGIRDALERTASSRKRARSFVDPTVDAAVARIMDQGVSRGWEVRPLGDLADVNPRRSKVDPDEPAAFVPMAAVDAETGDVKQPETRPAGTLNGSYRQFRRGDILFARITPCMQNGKTAIFDESLEYGYGSSEFHIVRANDAAHVPWLHRYLRTQALRRAAAQRMTGTAGQQRVPAAFLATTLVPIPPAVEITTWVAAIDRLSSFRLRLHALERHGSEVAKAVEPAVMNELFDSLH